MQTSWSLARRPPSFSLKLIQRQVFRVTILFHKPCEIRPTVNMCASVVHTIHHRPTLIVCNHWLAIIEHVTRYSMPYDKSRSSL